MLDGGPGAESVGRLDAWLVTDERAELRSQLGRLAAERGLRPHAGSFQRGELRIDPHPVVHTSHPTFGYLIEAPEGTVVWAPEFLEFPCWAHGAGLMFAEAAGWERPIRFAGDHGMDQGEQLAAGVGRARPGPQIEQLVGSLLDP